MDVAELNKGEIIGKFKRHDQDTGSPEIQVALLTARIQVLTDHLKTHRKDFDSRRGLLVLVGQRRRMLDYLKRHEEPRYLELIKQLGIRK